MCAYLKQSMKFREEDNDSLFLGTITAGKDPWTVDLQLKNKNVHFKIDTGADVTVIPDYVFNTVYSSNKPPLRKSPKPLLGPGGAPLDVLGATDILLQRGERQTLEEVFVIRSLHTALLGRSAGVKLGLVARLDSIDMQTLKDSYPKLCNGLGMIQQPYTIKLKPDALPHSLKTPRRIPLPLMPKVKKEIERVEKLGVISRVEEPTDWCSGIVVVRYRPHQVKRVSVQGKMHPPIRRADPRLTSWGQGF